MSRALRTSSDDQPSTSRNRITAAWFAGRRRSPRQSARESPRRAAVPPAARAAATTSDRDSARRPPAGTGPRRLPPRARGPDPASDENGTTRPSRCARVFAVLTRIRKTQVLSEERPSKRSSALSTRSHVSPTTSSAIARDGTKICATRSIDAFHSRTTCRKAASSPARREATSWASVGSTLKNVLR